MNLSDRIALFNTGRIEQVGTPEELYQRPETLFTARFLGDSTVFELPQTPQGTIAWEDNTWAVDPRTISPRALPGGRAALVVRPEDVHIATDEAVPPGVNSVAATVRDVEYMGAYRTAVLSIGRGEVVGRARVDALETKLTVGQAVVAWWRPERQRIVAA